MKLRKKFIPLLLFCVLVVSVSMSAFAAVEDTGFSDVAADAWYAEAVAYCRDNGLMSGTTPATFSPNGAMTRAMLASVLHRAADSPNGAAANPFTDVKDSAWYADAVVWAQENNVISGYGGGLFGAGDPVTREQIAAILWRCAGSPAAGSGTDFTDEASISDFAKAAVDWAREKAIINGKTGNRFDPKGNATRAEVAAILVNYAKSGSSDPSPAPTPDTNVDSKILIAYFSKSGNTETVSNFIHEEVGGDLFEIATVNAYPDSYNETLTVAQEELNADARPALSGAVDNMEDYDVIFVGFPIWYGTAPMAVHTFMESYDFSGKTIVPYCTSGGSGIGSSVSYIKSVCPNATVLEDLTISGSSAGSSQDTVASWLNRIGLSD